MGGVTAGTVVLAQLTAIGAPGGAGTYSVSTSQTATGPSMSGAFSGVLASIAVVSGGVGYQGGLPNFVTEWNNKQHFNTYTSYTNTPTHPLNSAAYTDIPLIQNFSKGVSPVDDSIPATSTLNITYPIPPLPTDPLNYVFGEGATGLAILNTVSTFDGYISGTTMTVTSAPTNPLTIGYGIQLALTQPGLVLDPTVPPVLINTVIISFGSGSGGTGTYTVYPVENGNGQTVGSSTTPVLLAATNGQLGSVLLTNGGSNYPGSATVTAMGGKPIIGSQFPGGAPKGVPARVSASVSGGVVTSLSLNATAKGAGYGTFPFLSIFGPIANPLDQPFYNYPYLAYDAVDKFLDFAAHLIRANRKTDELVLFLNPFCNHDYSVNLGMFAIDTVDSYYNYDLKVKKFMKRLHRMYEPEEMLFGITSCEGNSGITAYWWQRGFKNIVYDDISAMTSALNNAILVATGVSNAINRIELSDIWMAPVYFTQTAAVQQAILQVTRDTMVSFNSVKSAYISHELLQLNLPEWQEESTLRAEVFLGRSGQVKYLTKTMNYVNFQPLFYGTTDSISWDSGCHNPLALYRKGTHITNKTDLRARSHGTIAVDVGGIVESA